MPVKFMKSTAIAAMLAFTAPIFASSSGTSGGGGTPDGGSVPCKLSSSLIKNRPQLVPKLRAAEELKLGCFLDDLVASYPTGSDDDGVKYYKTTKNGEYTLTKDGTVEAQAFLMTAQARQNYLSISKDIQSILSAGAKSSAATNEKIDTVKAAVTVNYNEIIKIQDIVAQWGNGGGGGSGDPASDPERAKLIERLGSIKSPANDLKNAEYACSKLDTNALEVLSQKISTASGSALAIIDAAGGYLKNHPDDADFRAIFEMAQTTSDEIKSSLLKIMNIQSFVNAFDGTSGLFPSVEQCMNSESGAKK